ncbi:hypothetical protein FHN55_00970 [Streptomyces sp. NP160]|uniref:YciI family protein n=1 Tax=Streptomyces sp. NP160 TaxID=2586637 RepID=UPI001117EF99|nr:YciI family protein [Streptomyces sp. NP160]TNM70286.1 hypothetical protein FHN55_00970 [Streptomyces sp. NP160]
MTKYLISFDDGSMDHITDDELPAVSEASHAVVREAQAAGVWVFGGGLRRQRPTVVGTDGSTTDGAEPFSKAMVGGFCVVDVPTRAEALQWAARIAAGCRCAQEVREIMDDPDA